MTSRWEELYRGDRRTRETAHSQAAEWAAGLFLQEGSRVILDLGCGAGRDSFYLAGRGLAVVGLDLARSGLERTRCHDALLPFVQGDARLLPFPDGAFDGVYCFGLLHEFVGPTWETAVEAVMTEVGRVLPPGGLLVLTALAGDPAAGLPQVHLFSEQEFAAATRGFALRQRDCYADRGCTGREDYRVWYAVLEKPGAAGGGESVGKR